MSNDRIRSACDLLSSRSLAKLTTSKSSTLSAPFPTKSINQLDIIELAVDSSDDDENTREQVGIHMRSRTQIKTEETQLSTKGGMQRLSSAYHANNHSCADLHELLDTLNADEKQKLARRAKVYKPGMKVRSFLPMLCPPYTYMLTEC